jgi:hypothetical protein
LESPRVAGGSIVQNIVALAHYTHTGLHNAESLRRCFPGPHDALPRTIAFKMPTWHLCTWNSISGTCLTKPHVQLHLLYEVCCIATEPTGTRITTTPHEDTKATKQTKHTKATLCSCTRERKQHRVNTLRTRQEVQHPCTCNKRYTSPNRHPIRPQLG